MKPLGVDQFLKKKFKLLGLAGKWAATLGDVPEAFQAIIFGKSGNGKTEFCIQLAKHLAGFDKVAWLSYEQGHGADLQAACFRNKIDEVSGRFIVIDPMEKLPAGVSLFEDLDRYLSRRGSPRFIFIDSLDYTKFTFDEYNRLKLKHGKRKTIIWISHAAGREPKSKAGADILYDLHIGVLVSKYIATPVKNRFSGFEDYIIWEEKARQLNPLYFAAKAGTAEPKKPKRTKKASPKEE